MKNKQKFIRFYGECRDGQWTLICLEFSLAAQDESLEVAKQKLRSQVVSYVNDANGIDAAHASYLLSRSAPLVYWAKFYFYVFLQKLVHSKPKGHIAARREMDALLAAA